MAPLPSFWIVLQLNQRLSGDVCWLEIVRLVSQFRELGVTPLHLPPAAASVPSSVESALLAVDALAQHNLLVSQFVGDLFVSQSTLWGIRRACRALGRTALQQVSLSCPSCMFLPFHVLA